MCVGGKLLARGVIFSLVLFYSNSQIRRYVWLYVVWLKHRISWCFPNKKISSVK